MIALKLGIRIIYIYRIESIALDVALSVVAIARRVTPSAHFDAQ